MNKYSYNHDNEMCELDGGHGATLTNHSNHYVVHVYIAIAKSTLSIATETHWFSLYLDEARDSLDKAFDE